MDNLNCIIEVSLLSQPILIKVPKKPFTQHQFELLPPHWAGYTGLTFVQSRMPDANAEQVTNMPE